MRTTSDHAGADLRVDDPKTSAQFIEMLNDIDAPLPWDVVEEVKQIVDAKGYYVCDVQDVRAAHMIVLAVNTCGSFRATRA